MYINRVYFILIFSIIVTNLNNCNYNVPFLLISTTHYKNIIMSYLTFQFVFLFFPLQFLLFKGISYKIMSERVNRIECHTLVHFTLLQQLNLKCSFLLK